ncbi:hypothetical protein RUM44_008156 [Polyplax serrata]|uniref:MICAL-like protein 1 n=1 Tax=Polyplax serrata TaxID=468196 RepID=A0ABR1B9B1_POLSC
MLEARVFANCLVSSGRLETCWSCRRPVFLAERLVAGGKLRHRTCFTCKRCGNQLNLVGYYETETGDFVCETCPDEEKEREGKGEEVPVSGDTRMSAGYPKDEYSLDFEKALDASVEKGDRNTNEKDTVDSQSEETCPASHVEQKMLEKMKTGLPPECTDNNQHNTANLEALNIKIKSLLGRDFTETLSLLNHEPESFIADISEIIDNVISDAVTEVEIRRGGGTEKSDLPHAEEIAEIKLNDKSFVAVIDTDSTTAEEDNSVTLITEDVPADDTVQVETVEVSKKDSDEKVVHDTSEVVENKQDDYPEDLNPFADDDDEEETPNKQTKTPVTPKKQPPVTPRRLVLNKKAVDKGQNPNLNPFWSDGEPESEDEGIKPVPAPRTSLRSSEEDPSRLHYGSFTSLNSMGSTVSRRKKGPAPAPPSGHKSLQYPASPQSNKSMSPMYRSPSPSMSIRSHRKSKPAPPPPPVNIYRSEESDVLSGKKEKNYENKVKQNLSVPDKSSYGKWKRKKSQAPSLPIPQRRRIAPLPLPEFYRELEDLEIQQRELERQGVSLEQTIRMYDEESPDVLEGGDTTAKDIEGLILQLFEIVNQKNELFRRQAELMYLRRQQRLEEEHADIEYQIRCLMGRPERNKTDSDKEQEEELIRRLVEVVERRNEIIECLDMDRRREVEEDKSIHHHLEAFAARVCGKKSPSVSLQGKRGETGGIIRSRFE